MAWHLVFSDWHEEQNTDASNILQTQSNKLCAFCIRIKYPRVHNRSQCTFYPRNETFTCWHLYLT